MLNPSLIEISVFSTISKQAQRRRKLRLCTKKESLMQCEMAEEYCEKIVFLLSACSVSKKSRRRQAIRRKRNFIHLKFSCMNNLFMSYLHIPTSEDLLLLHLLAGIADTTAAANAERVNRY